MRHPLLDELMKSLDSKAQSTDPKELLEVLESLTNNTKAEVNKVLKELNILDMLTIGRMLSQSVFTNPIVKLINGAAILCIMQEQTRRCREFLDKTK